MPAFSRTHSPGVVSGSQLKRLGRDPLLYDDNGAVLYMADFGLDWCRDTVTPYNGQPIYDMSGRPASTLLSGHADGQVKQTTSGMIAQAGGGLYFGGASAVNNYAEIPAAVTTRLAAGNQRFLSVIYLKMPAVADWTTVNGSFCNFLSFSDGTNGYTDSPEFQQFTASVAGSTKQLYFHRQRGAAAGSTDFSSLNLVDADCGIFTQLAFCRSATAQFGRLRNTTRTAQTANITDNGLNTNAFGGLTGKFGIGPSRWAAASLVARKWTGYRQWIADLDVASWTDISAVLDADWNRQIARGVFS